MGRGFPLVGKCTSGQGDGGQGRTIRTAPLEIPPRRKREAVVGWGGVGVVVWVFVGRERKKRWG